jgi:hypothetical protein
MKRLFNRLPGPLPLKIILAAIIVIIALVALFFIYDWMGRTLLDSGGSIQ